jgi:hypothetical protein
MKSPASRGPAWWGVGRGGQSVHSAPPPRSGESSHFEAASSRCASKSTWREQHSRAALPLRCCAAAHHRRTMLRRSARRTTYSGGAACVGPSGSWAVLSAVQGTQGTHGDSGGTMRRSVEIMGTVGWVLGVLPRHSGVLREIRLLTVLRGDWWRSGPIRGTPWYSGYSGGPTTSVSGIVPSKYPSRLRRASPPPRRALL